tara:strand:+ start:86 stop:796 length:711 start_codon:yes stop_codon:yes gene_type:complete
MSLKPGTNYTVTKHTGVGGVTSVTKDPFSPTQIGRTHISAQTFTVPTADVDNADHVIQGGHGLSTGDAVVYNSMGGDSIGIGGSMEPDVGEVDVHNNTIYDATAHGFETGDKVRYENGSGSDIGNLSNGGYYFVIKLDANMIKLADTYNDALDGNARNLTSTGNDNQVVKKFLQDNRTYYVSKKTADQFYLHHTHASAIADTAGDGTGKIVLDNTLKGNNNQVFSTSFARLSPTVD